MPVVSSKKSYRVGRARTGLGLFATKPIKKGDKIIRYFGPLLDSKNKEDDAVDNRYLFEVSNRWTIDGSIRKNIARYINHSCRPNSESDVSVRKRRVLIRATRNIEPGEEINYDYGRDYFKIFLKPIGCKCDHCEKKRKKERAEARAEKARLKLKAEKKAAKAAEKATAAKSDTKAKKAETKTKAAKANGPSKASKSKAAKSLAAKPEAHARGAGKVTKTKAGRTAPAAVTTKTAGRDKTKARS